MKIDVLGVKVGDLSYDEAVDLVREYWRVGGKHYLVTPNPEMVMYADQHPDHKEILNKADAAVADGVGIVLASKMLGHSLKGRVTGTDLAEKLIEEAAKSGETVFFLGGHGGVAEESAKRFENRLVGLKIAGWEEGNANESGDEDTRKTIGEKKIGLLLVAYGSPKQEYWIARNLPYLNVKVAIGIGGAFDFWTGRSTRASKWMRDLGLEWLYRLIKEPWRFKRQLVLPMFVVKVFAESLKKK